ncbi:transcriptional regulator [Nocardia stercoris]|uniref:Transcriptional regulator n=2 Tax=Nocardia stercoris TaxID=2483361 RepID=A0A3M2L532_9NOCA|nr:transcriptional regulator [Nocardia stercoris]
MSYSSWYTTCATGLAPLQRSLIVLEDRAELLREWNPELVNGLLQTEAYARSVLDRCIGILGVPEDLNAVVQARMQRQEILDREGHRFRILIGEGALRRVVGNHTLMAGQLSHLLTILESRPHVEIGVVPMTAEFLAPTPAFSIRDDIAVDTETVSGEVVTTSADDVALAARTFELLSTTAVFGSKARDLIARALAEHR